VINLRWVLGALGDLYGEVEHRIVAGWHYRKVRTFQDLLDMEIADDLYERDREFEPARWQQLTTEMALLRCGLFITGAGPGGRNEKADIEYRASVAGFADDATVAWLTEILDESLYELDVQDLYVTGDRAPGVPLVRDASTHARWGCLGRPQDAREILRTFPVPRRVRGELTGRRQVIVFDPEWGDSDLFSFLLDAALARQAAVGAAGKGGQA
jgi:hypothetical protein